MIIILVILVFQIHTIIYLKERSYVINLLIYVSSLPLNEI